MKLHLIAAGLAVAAALPAQAVLTTSAGAIAGPTTTVDFESFDGLLTSGPETVAPGIVFTGDTGAELGAAARDLGDNGLWGAIGHFAAGGVAGELRFTFTGGLTSGVGAFVSHYANAALPFDLAVEVSAYGDNNQIIETHSFTVSATSNDYNAGQFLGITRGQADIRSISFKGLGVVADDLVLTTPVPEPGTWAMLLAGLLAVGFVGTRQRRG